MVKETITLEISHDALGRPLVFITNLSEQQKEQLRVLQESDSWKLYARLLNQAGIAYQTSMLSADRSFKMAKIAGLIAGLNFAVNQLGQIVAGKKQKAEHVENATKNSPHARGLDRQEF